MTTSLDEFPFNDKNLMVIDEIMNQSSLQFWAPNSISLPQVELCDVRRD